MFMQLYEYKKDSWFGKKKQREVFSISIEDKNSKSPGNHHAIREESMKTTVFGSFPDKKHNSILRFDPDQPGK